MNIDDSIRRLVYDLTAKNPEDRLTINKLMNHYWIRPYFKDIIEEIKKNNDKIEKINKAKIESELKLIESQVPINSENDIKSKKNLRVLTTGISSSQNFINFAALNSVNSLFIQTNQTSENSYCLLSPGKSFGSLMESPSIL